MRSGAPKGGGTRERLTLGGPRRERHKKKTSEASMPLKIQKGTFKKEVKSYERSQYVAENTGMTFQKQIENNTNEASILLKINERC